MRKDWIEIKIGDIISKNGVFSDGDWVESKDQDPNGEVRLIQLADVGDGCFLDKSNRFLTTDKAEELNCTYLQKGDILLARMPHPLGRAAIFPLSGAKKFVTVVDVAIIRLGHNYISNKFMLYNLNSPYSRKKIEELQSGTTRKRISRKNLSKIEFPLAPLPEQRAIVSKIEQLFSKLDNGIANLKAAKEKLEIYRQAVLKKAFEGELTKEWRERQNHDAKDSQDDPDSKSDIQSHQKNQDSDNGKLPEGWRIVEISKVGEIITGSTPSKKNKEFYSNRDYNFYKPTDLDAGNIVSKSIDGLSKVGFEAGRQAPKNSILVTCIGATIGKTGLIIKPGCFNQQINAIIPFEDYEPKFIYYQAIGIDFQNQIKSKASATTLPILNKGKFSKLTMKVCSKVEQHQIVREIETRLSVCDNVLANINEVLEKTEALRQSILKKAFEGKLLSEEELEACRKEPDWEPAEKLLARIEQSQNKETKDKKAAKA